MGAKYAPSVAKLCMHKWKEEQIYSGERPNLIFYRCYIDDIVMIWRGTETSLERLIPISMGSPFQEVGDKIALPI